jgi:ribonuclease J
MRVRIHRGAQEVGGACIEVESSGSRIVLDVGRPLDAPREEFVPLPDVTGLRDQNASLLGLIISHGHQDHWGLIDQLSKGVPVFIGEQENPPRR